MTWNRTVSATELTASYEAMLACAAQRGNCRFWLLDCSQLTWAGSAFWQWLGQEFTPRATQVLGGAVYVAYLVAPHQLADAKNTGPTVRNRAADNTFFCETAALASEWLRDQQVLEATETELPDSYPNPFRPGAPSRHS